MIIETLNKERADAMFRREAVFLSKADGIPEGRAKELFGKTAVTHAARLSSMSGYGIGDYTAMCLTYRGFLAAVSYQNVELIQAQEQKENAAPVLTHQSGKVEHV